MPEFEVPKGKVSREIVVKGSKFIAQAEYVSDPEEARDKIAECREEHPGSTHVVYAFITGKPNSQTMGMSDDGEPKGTAGRPVLEVLKGSGLTYVLATVVRYFGGTKLGTGGLVRAYSQALKEALAVLKRLPLVERQRFTLTVPYELYEPAVRLIGSYEGEVEDEEFTTAVTISGWIPVRAVPGVQDEIDTLSRGSLSLEVHA